MPTVPLPPIGGDGVSIDGGDLPVNSIADVQAAWAQEIQGSTGPSPVLAAIQNGQFAMLVDYQNISSYAAAQSDPARATDEYLDEILEENGCPRKEGQSDAAARAIMFSTPPVVSPNAILTVANGVLSEYTKIQCRYSERSDGFFIGTGSTPWSSHAYALVDVGSVNATPNFPDRPQTLNRRPPGIVPNADTFGRWMLLRVPNISSLDNSITVAFATVASVNTGLTTTITASSGGQTLPQATIFVASVTGFPTSGGLYVTTLAGLVFVTYTGVNVGANSFTGCSLGSGTMVTSGSVFQIAGNVSAPASTVSGGMFVGTGTTLTDDNTSYMFGFDANTVDGVYNNLIAAVDNAVGFSIRWDLLIDDMLV